MTAQSSSAQSSAQSSRESSLASRRAVLGGLAGAGAALPLVAGCGSAGSASGASGSGGSSGSAPGGSGSSGSANGAAGGAVLAKTSQIPIGSGKVFADRKVVVTQPKQGEFKCFSAVCTHQGCIVQKVARDEIDCGCHGSRFSASDGSVLAGPATQPLAPEHIVVKGDSITLG